MSVLPICSTCYCAFDGDQGSTGGSYVIPKEGTPQSWKEEGQASYKPIDRLLVRGLLLTIILQVYRRITHCSSS